MDWGFLFVARPESQMTLIQQTLTIAGCHMSHSHNQTNDADDGGKTQSVSATGSGPQTYILQSERCTLYSLYMYLHIQVANPL